ncbi:hypothetical protein [Flavobacterium silvaticum]|uniref:Uncharacterized protein n=1 Tax=Flavobacterium silvaticum TaxID=1852020 RepID=A0A972FNQ9_9FLAO|nr:hypothetical protein [Flavobacterium silvaticum]NMH29401.1 hypothetical protein [Flavobacterium silvaticum]
MNIKKTALIALGATAIAVSFGFAGIMGFRAFTKKIYTNRSCEWANIDHIELRARINIPAIRDCDCNYDDTQKQKTSLFHISTAVVDMDQYVKRNRLKLNQRAAQKATALFTDPDLRNAENLYFRSGSSASHDYVLLLNKQTGTLGVRIDYKE